MKKFGVEAFFVCQPDARGVPHIGLKYVRDGDVASLKNDCLWPFCFPVSAELHTRRQVSTAELYTFTKTGALGERVHGFCRKIFWSPTIRGPKFPIVLCLLSSELWTIFHFKVQSQKLYDSFGRRFPILKVLEVAEACLQREALLSATPLATLPTHSATAGFLTTLNQKLTAQYEPGADLTLPLPVFTPPLEIDPPVRIRAIDGRGGDPLKSTGEYIQLQIPPLLGGSEQMAGVALARLLWHVPVQCLMTLIASLLLERRIIMISRNKETVSCAIHGASALIYPFEWSSTFYLPLLPEKLRDYLQAPFPFLVGLPAELADFKGLEIDEVTVIDLDLGICVPESGSNEDDAQLLPKRKQLQEALHAAVKALRSPTEFEGNMRVAEVMTNYMVRLFKNYRQYIKPKEPIYLTRDRGCFTPTKSEKGQSPKTQKRPVRGFKSELPSQFDSVDGAIDGDGNYFDHTQFVASHQSKKDRAFLEMLRQSQMYEVFITERLGMAMRGVYPESDPFEHKISLIHEHSQKGRHPMRHWSRRLPALPMNVSRQIRKTQTQIQRNTEFLNLDDLLMSMPPVQLLPKLPSVRRRASSRRLFAGKSLKNVVAELSKQASRKAQRPGDYLQQSRASCPIPEAPEKDDIPETPHSMSPRLLAQIDSESSDESVPVQLIDIPEAGGKLAPSPWNDSPKQHIFDAFAASEPQETSEPVGIAFTHSSGTESPMSMREIRSKQMVTPECSFRIGLEEWGHQNQIPKEMRLPKEEGPEESANSFLASNLEALEKESVVRLGLPPKPKQTGKLQFHRSNAFTFK